MDADVFRPDSRDSDMRAIHHGVNGLEAMLTDAEAAAGPVTPDLAGRSRSAPTAHIGSTHRDRSGCGTDPVAFGDIAFNGRTECEHRHALSPAGGADHAAHAK
ncbi:hypothetical protein [Nocardia terpenica]|uniref:hypothetical protein n=1 Tax=Nocardia terpenica TaxID=455432 RepID=UPI0012FD766B|nr:hypothetical protein [Nocardia terpenica]